MPRTKTVSGRGVMMIMALMLQVGFADDGAASDDAVLSDTADADDTASGQKTRCPRYNVVIEAR